MIDDRYAAGLFDGEGTVRISRWQKPNSTHIRYQLIIALGVTFRPVVEDFHKKYGGSVSMIRHDLRNPKNRLVFQWTVASQIGAEFLRRILPFAIIKKDEIEIALEFQEHIDAHPYTPAGRSKKGAPHTTFRPDRDEILAHREVLFRRITELKKRSFPPLLNGGTSESVDRH